MSNWKRNIALFLSSQGISMLGSSIVQYAILWHITLTTQSGLMMTLYIICGFLPTFFLSPFAGVWADRYNRKKLIMIADGGIALSTLLLAILFLLGYQYIWLLFIIAAIRAFGAGLQGPAVGAILPQIVPQEKLMRVNGFNGTIQAAIMFIAPIISAGLLTLTTLEMIFFVDVVTAVIAIVTLTFIHLAKHEVTTEPLSYLEDFKSGLRYIQNSTFLKNYFLFIAILFFLMAPASFLTPLQVTRTFGEEVWRLTAIELAFSIGMMVGGAIIALWQGFNNRVYTMILGGIIFSLCTISLGIIPSFWPYIVVMGICGVAIPIFNTPTTTLLQEKVDPSFIGRIFGVFNMIASAMMPLGMLLFGPLGDVISVEILLITSGFCMLLLTVALRFNKRLVSEGEKVDLSSS